MLSLLLFEYTSKSKYQFLHPRWNIWFEIFYTWVASQLIPTKLHQEPFLGTEGERRNLLNDFPGPPGSSDSTPVCSWSFVSNPGCTSTCYAQVLFSTHFLSFICCQNERFIWKWHLANSYLHSPSKKRQGTQDRVLRHWQEVFIYKCDQNIGGEKQI